MCEHVGRAPFGPHPCCGAPVRLSWGQPYVLLAILPLGWQLPCRSEAEPCHRGTSLARFSMMRIALTGICQSPSECASRQHPASFGWSAASYGGTACCSRVACAGTAAAAPAFAQYDSGSTQCLGYHDMPDHSLQTVVSSLRLSSLLTAKPAHWSYIYQCSYRA